MCKGISVIICCYNSERTIVEVLTGLCKQQQTDFGWEIILVDNNCSDKTVDLALNYWNNSGSQIPFYAIKETEPGLSFAREAGVKKSTFEFILFCDDDNYLSDNYLNEVFSIIQQQKVGIVGCKSLPKYLDEPIPNWFLNDEQTFAIGTLSSTTQNITNGYGRVWGAGMVIRKTIFDELKRRKVKQFLSDRIGSTMTTGGDTELCYFARALGYEIWFSTDCFFYHLMTSKRFDFTKYIELNYQNSFNYPYLACLRNRQYPSLVFYLYKAIIFGGSYFILRLKNLKETTAVKIQLATKKGLFKGYFNVLLNYPVIVKNLKKIYLTNL